MPLLRLSISFAAREAVPSFRNLNLAAAHPSCPLLPPPPPLPPLERMPPDYESQAYWNARFEDERHFEWLGDGADTLLPILRTDLLASLSSARSPAPPCLTSPTVDPAARAQPPPRLLHIGAGTSSLSERLRELYHELFGPAVDERALVHADYAAGLVARRRAAELARGGRMRWACVDALDWAQAQALLEGGVGGRAFAAVVDKSTSDAVSCGEDLAFGAPTSRARLHPALRRGPSAGGAAGLVLEPMALFALHLAALVRPGGLWIALTFSAARFEFLVDAAHHYVVLLRRTDACLQ
ncbi:uncharacterized protein BXZ73DRAFT_96749 [Epithele typhae]|uniref:uncharacterized protein n=1 Tax=Epithele typhae TaxID=378194 RepID=UPI0020077562|nr:uncharacterized protein BXZ73DRAFT_96749 [Epithele typhae]KAH9944256.1 hypothetical protein BXZ73DRAFT_96749 [Epithele typhae]